jgi:hypothetical protein
MIGSIRFHAAPTMIANVHRHANDCIVDTSGLDAAMTIAGAVPRRAARRAAVMFDG